MDFTTDYIEMLPRENSVVVLNSRLLRADDPVVEKARSGYVFNILALAIIS